MINTPARLLDPWHSVKVVRSRATVCTMAAVTLAITISTVGISADELEPAATEVPDELVATPSQAEGPYYPVELPADRDANLIQVAGADIPATGEALVIEGLLLTTDGEPVEGAVVEIWQTDHQGVYLHPQDPDIASRDDAFQGYGESVTEATGAWSFRTILPEIYGGRPRHIHAKIKADGETVLTTQIYFSGGDIPAEGTVAVTDDATDALTVEVLRGAGADGEEVLQARHLIVIPMPAAS